MVKSFGIDGKVTQEALEAIGLTANANSVPDDTLPPSRPSGLRVGTPAITTRGLKTEHMAQIADWMKQAIESREDTAQLETLAAEVKKFVADFPLPSDAK